MPIGLVVGVLVVGIISVQINAYGALIFAVVAMGAGITSADDFLMLVLANFVMLMLVNLLVKGRQGL